MRVLNRIHKLSKETGESVQQIVERAIDIYAKRAKARLTAGDDELAKLMSIPKNRALFEQITSAMGRRSSSSLTPEQHAARTSAGGTARAKNLSPERRKEIAAAAGVESARKRAEKKRLAEEAGGSRPDPVE